MEQEGLRRAIKKDNLFFKLIVSVVILLIGLWLFKTRIHYSRPCPNGGKLFLVFIAHNRF